MTVLISGASGLIGRAVSVCLVANGHTVIRLVRDQNQVTEEAVFWNPMAGEFDTTTLPAINAVINLSGHSLAAGRWSDRTMQTIYDSRIQSTHLLAERIGSLDPRPQVMISASATGFYGDCGDHVVDETSPVGVGFLADLCRDWEAAAQSVTKQGIRLVSLRTGLVLTKHGGMLHKTLPIFRLGLGGRLGGGQAWMAWISLHDLVELIIFALENESVSGPINAVAPEPVTNTEFTKVLARLLKRPAIFPVPALALRLIFGRMTDEALLLSTRATSTVLSKYGFRFTHSDLESALLAALA